MFSHIIRSQEIDIVSATKAIIETHLAIKGCYNYSKGIIKKTKIIVHYTTEKMSNLTVKLMNLQRAGFH